MKTSKRPLALLILDGWGYREGTHMNAVHHANTPVLDRLNAEYAHSLISGSGKDVGLPDGQMGNSEVGHINIGSGRIVYQELTRISKAIEDGEFEQTQALIERSTLPSSRRRSTHHGTVVTRRCSQP